MPGLYGVIGRGADTDLGDALSAMADAMRHYPWYVEHSYVDREGGVALGRLSLGVLETAEQPARNEDESVLAFMDGEIFDSSALRRRLEQAGHRFRSASQAEVLVHGYEESGPAFFKEIEGAFVAAIWEKTTSRLIVVNDRFGMKPLYYSHRPGALLIGSEIKALLADEGVSRELDPRGVAHFFSFGQFLGEQTLLSSVRTLPGAAWLTYDSTSDRLELSRYARLAGREESRSDADHLEAIDSAFERAVARRTAGDHQFGISLSGGLDSRSILGLIETRKTPVTTVSMGMAGSVDHQSAAEMARLSGCRHHAYYNDERFLADYEQHLRRMVELTDGHYLSQCIAEPAIPLYRELGIEVLLRGHAGELMHLDKAYNFSLDRTGLTLNGNAAIEQWLWSRLRGWLSGSEASGIFRPDFARNLEDLARDSLREALRESEEIHPPGHRIAHLFLTQRLRRETALSMVQFGTLVETRLPFLDAQLVDRLFEAPIQLKLGDRIQTHILRKHRPAFLDVVNANTGTRMGAGRLEKFLAKGRMKVFGKLGVPGYQPYERLGLWLRRDLRPLVSRLLSQESLLDLGVIDPDGLRKVLDENDRGVRNHTYLIQAAMIFALGCQQLLEGSACRSEATPAGH